jgi:hypothetical protein
VGGYGKREVGHLLCIIRVRDARRAGDGVGDGCDLAGRGWRVAGEGGDGGVDEPDDVGADGGYDDGGGGCWMDAVMLAGWLTGETAEVVALLGMDI